MEHEWSCTFYINIVPNNEPEDNVAPKYMPENNNQSHHDGNQVYDDEPADEEPELKDVEDSSKNKSDDKLCIEETRG